MAVRRHWAGADLAPDGAGGLRCVLADGAHLRAVLHRFPAGASIPAHAHRASDETFQLLSGAAVFTIAGRRIAAAAGDLLFAAAGEPHAIEVGPQPLLLLVVVAPNVHDAEPASP